MIERIGRAPRLATLLTRHRQRVAEGWAAKIDQRLSKTGADWEARAWTWRAIAGLIEGLVTRSYDALEECARSLARERRRSGDELAAVIDALLALNEVVVPLMWRSDSAVGPGVGEAVADLNAGLRLMVREASRLYTVSARRDLQNQHRRTGFMLDLARTAVSSLELTEVLQRIVQQGAAIFRMDCVLFDVDLQEQALVARARASRPERRHEQPGRVALSPRLLRLLRELTEEAPAIPPPLACYRAASGPCREMAEALGYGAALLVPIVTERRTMLAVLGRPLGETYRFAPGEVSLAQGFANTAVLAIDNADLYEETRQRLAETEALQRVTVALLQQMELEDVLEIVCREARALTGATGSAVLILEDGEWLRVAHTVGALRTGSDRLPIEGSFAGLVARTGEPLLINNAYREMLAYRQYGRLEALLSLPLVAQENIIGTLDLVNKPGGFGADDLRVMMLFANQAAIAIENARLLQQGEQLAVLQERHRLSRELHDSVTQALYSLTLYADAIRIALRNERYDDARSNLAELREVAREAMVEMRLLVFRLHPPLVEEEGLVSALQHRLAAVESRAGLRTQLLADEVNDLPLEVQQTLYGVAQEALNNVVKHAQADEVTVGLWRKDGGLVLEVADDGLGIDPNKAEASGGMGLRSMRERAAAIGGDLLIETQEGEGTVVRVRIDKGAAGE